MNTQNELTAFCADFVREIRGACETWEKEQPAGQVDEEREGLTTNEDDIKMKKVGTKSQQKGNANFFSHVANTLAQLTNARSSWDVCLLSRNDTTSAVGVPKSPEEPLDGLPHIFKANRICGQCNYVLSQGACRRILRSGFHQAMFCIDDFISAITVGHFREDVMLHPAVGQIRTQGGALSMYIDVSAENFFSVETCPTSDTDYPVVPDGAEESNHSVSGRARWHEKIFGEI